MDHKLLLAKCVTLLYKVSLKEPNESEETIKELIKETISKIQPREVGLGFGLDKDIINALKETVRDLLDNSHDQGIDRASLIQRIRINVGENDKLYQAIEQSLNEEQTQEELRKSINSIRRSIKTHLDEIKVAEVLNSASASWNYHRDKIKNTSDFLKTVWSQLEPLASLKAVEDPGIINQIRLSDKEEVSKLISNIHVSITENRVYRTGWQALNRMMQGGIRPGEMWLAGALQHKYKTGLTQSIFNQFALYNQPMIIKPGKKPALVLIAFEDTMEERFQFIFKQMMYTQTRAGVEIGNYTAEQIQNFVLEKLSINGFELFFYRVNPSKWSYIDLFNKITELERQDYSIEFVALDYLEKLPTTGCIQSGAMGNDILDLFSRVRTFFSAKGIPLWTPHQLSTECKQLIRGTVTEDKLVQALVGRGYYKGTRQLDQIPDGIILCHLFKHGDETYLAIQRDRHRISSIVEEKYKHFFLKFPKGQPIPDDLYGEDSSLSKLPPYSSNVDNVDDLFSFN